MDPSSSSQDWRVGRGGLTPERGRGGRGRRGRGGDFEDAEASFGRGGGGRGGWTRSASSYEEVQRQGYEERGRGGGGYGGGGRAGRWGDQEGGSRGRGGRGYGEQRGPGFQEYGGPSEATQWSGRGGRRGGGRDYGEPGRGLRIYGEESESSSRGRGGRDYGAPGRGRGFTGYEETGYGGRGRGGGGGRRGGMLQPHQEPLGEQLIQQISHMDISASTSQPPLPFLPPELGPEDEEAAAPAIATPDPCHSTALAPPRRQSFGTLGKVVRLAANHFRVNFGLGVICQYDVEFNPRLTSKLIARAVLRQLLAAYSAKFGCKQPAYDGRKSIYTAGPLPFQHEDFEITYVEEQGVSGLGLGKKFAVTIKHAADFNLKALESFLAGRRQSLPQELIQAFDVVLRESSTSNFFPIGRSFYKEAFGSEYLDGGYVAWNGFYQSLRPSMQGLVLNVDLSTTAFYDNVDVLEFLRRKLKNFNPARRLSDADRIKVKKALVRLKIEVTHRSTPRKYRIAGISPSATKDLKFPLDSGEEMRVVDYFKATYNYTIQYQELPCLQLQGKKISYLPMEVCKICEGQKFIGKLSDNQIRTVLKLACVRPNQREGQINSIMGMSNGPGRGNICQEFGLEVGTQMTSLTGRVLPAPKLRYGEYGEVKEIQPIKGAWNLLGSSVVEGGLVRYWTVVSFDSRTSKNTLNYFVNCLSKRCVELGVEMNNQTIVPPVCCGREHLESPLLEGVLRDVHVHATRMIKQNDPNGFLQLLVCIMGEKHPQYGQLKKICDTDIGVLTQCCLAKHVHECKSQYLANLVLKINAKMGGRNVTLALELPRLFPARFGGPTMILGADVTHPGAGDDSSPSIAAVVGNVDWPSANIYIARVRAQKAREEIILSLGEMFQELWKEFCNRVGRRPERILFFRDGVSEGQFNYILQHEVATLKETLNELGGETYTPLITLVVIQKRHHTRLFPKDQNFDKSGNMLPGTVVDTTITHPREFDFFLCSHAGLQGTSRPTHYHILHDENQFTSDELQTLINNLCYTYARCTRSVSVVPAAYYAHLAAYRARLYVDSEGSGSEVSSKQGPSTTSLPRIQPVVRRGMYYC